MRRQLLALLCLTVTLCGCAALRPEQAYDTVQPHTPPVRTSTNFSESLRCMDDLFTLYGLGVQGTGQIFVTSPGVLDKTGKNLGGDNRQTLISAISAMATRSGTVVFVDYNPRDLKDFIEHQIYIAQRDLPPPKYELVGAITLDENVSAASIGFSAAWGDADVGINADRRVTVLGVDLHVNDAITRHVLNGITTSNRIAVARKQIAGDGGGRIKKAGVFLNVSLDANEGGFAALRALIELSTIEVLGKLTKVPYWQCLQLEQTNPEVLATTQDWFNTLSEAERVAFVQRRLAQQGYYGAAVTGTFDTATREAVARYQAATDLTPSGRIDLALYRQLIAQDLRAWHRPIQARSEPAIQTQSATPEAPKLFIMLTTPRGTTPVYKVHETLSLSVQVSHNAYLYCYYRDGHRRISQIYPNRFQNKDNAYVSARQVITIPPTPHFALVLDTPNTTETVLCVASREDIQVWLPDHFRLELEALPLQTLEELVAAFRRNNPPSFVEARLTVQVQ